jgi:hypothetical protein
MKDHDLLRLAQVYAAARGVSLSAVAYRATDRSNATVFDRLLIGRRIHASTRAKLSSFFREQWPPFVPWPDGIRRRSCRRPAPVRAVSPRQSPP